MGEKKTLSERYAGEILTDNAALNHYSQCKDCVFRHKMVEDGEEYGYRTCVCRIYGRATALRSKYSNGKPFYSYTPMEYEDKPRGVYENTEQCEYYEKEKQRKK